MTKRTVQPQTFGARAILLMLLPGLMFVTGSQAGTLVESSTSPFGSFRGVEYVRHVGRFVGASSQGEFRVPFEIVTPANPKRGNGRVVFEPPHFLFGTIGRDVAIGQELLFGRRFTYASVGFSSNGFNLLDPFAPDAIIAGEPVVANVVPLQRDVEILKQFVDALSTDPHAGEIMGRVRMRYAYGVSQSAEALNELFYGPGGTELFDLTVLHVPVWRPDFATPDVLDVLPETFTPLSDIGKVMLISSEGDLLISHSAQLRAGVSGPAANRNYRLYEVAGAPHLSEDLVVDGVRLNPLDVSPVVRAAFVHGHLWASHGIRPPPSRLIDAADPAIVDPIYMFPTGIARDINGNAAGGVRFPDVENGRALHIASALDVEVIPGFPGLIGFWFDLACAPAPGSGSSAPRFRNHAAYVRSVIVQSTRLLVQGYLLPADALDLMLSAVRSDVGKPGTCDLAP